MKNNYCRPSTEVVDISTERQFLASTFKNDLPENSNMNATFYDDDWEVF